MATKAQLAKLEQVADDINDLRVNMINALMDVDGSLTSSELSDMSTDELFDMCQFYL